MKVLLINAVCGVGSTGKIAVDLIDTLEKNGHQGKVAFGLDCAKEISPEKIIKFNNKAGYYIHNILAKITDRTGLFSSRQTKKLIREIEKYNPDIIHLHNIHGYYINYEILFNYISQSGKPVVWTLHDCWSFTGHCAHFVSADCFQWKTHCKRCPLLKAYPTCYFRGDVENNFSRKKQLFTSAEKLEIVTPSGWLGDFAKQSFLGKYNVQVINNGIDLNIFRPVESDFRARHNLENKKIILGVSNVWNKQKGFEDFLALPKLLGGEYRIVMVGLTDEQLSALPAEIIGIKRTAEAQELAAVYSAGDVFVNPTYEDTFPTVNLEAQACGTPVVVYNTGGCPETIIDGFGAVVECGDIESLAENIKIWAKAEIQINEEKISQLSKHNCYLKYIRLYESLMK